MSERDRRDALRAQVLQLAEDDERVVATEPDSLRSALAAAVSALIHEAAEADLSTADVIAERLAELR